MNDEDNELKGNRQNGFNAGVQLNYGVIFRGRPRELELLSENIKSELGDVRIIFATTSGNRLRIVDEGGGSRG